MSQVKANSYYDASGGSNAQLYGVASPPNSMGFRNRIINGDMRIDQRNAGASVSVDGAQVYTLDRFRAQDATDGVFTVQQVTDAPTGFVNSAKITVTTADSSLAATQFANFTQFIEGYNTADLGWGTANAQSVTLSFWVKSSLTGAFGGALLNSAVNRSYPFSYTISAANTWEQKTVTIAGDTSGTWLTNSSTGIAVHWGLGVGSTYSGTAGAWAGALYLSATGATSVIGTNGATFYITGVQLEAGTVASPFERRPYGEMLMLCQRYCAVYSGGVGYRLGMGWTYSTTAGYVGFNLPVTMRSAPSISGTASLMTFNDAVSGYAAANAPTINSAQENFVSLSVTGASGMTAFRPAQVYFTNASSSLVLSAEL